MDAQHEQDESTPSPEYIKAKHNPSDRSKGFEKGMMKFEVEKKFDKTLPPLSKDRTEKDNRSIEKDMERD